MTWSPARTSAKRTTASVNTSGARRCDCARGRSYRRRVGIGSWFGRGDGSTAAAGFGPGPPDGRPDRPQAERDGVALGLRRQGRDEHLPRRTDPLAGLVRRGEVAPLGAAHLVDVVLVPLQRDLPRREPRRAHPGDADDGRDARADLRLRNSRRRRRPRSRGTRSGSFPLGILAP